MPYKSFSLSIVLMQILMWLNAVVFVLSFGTIVYSFVQTENGLLPILSYFIVPTAIGCLVSAIMFFITINGLLDRKPWAKYLAIVTAVIMLFGFPVGTVIGIIILYGMTKGWPEHETVAQSN